LRLPLRSRPLGPSLWPNGWIPARRCSSRAEVMGYAAFGGSEVEPSGRFLGRDFSRANLIGDGLGPAAASLDAAICPHAPSSPPPPAQPLARLLHRVAHLPPALYHRNAALVATSRRLHARRKNVSGNVREQAE
jgi:hypothetical protein